ncbi:hypothetical protein BLNAU_21278 [Blattamonas nauphoetae]|uniref:Uncharacterized protein n=1 Tax=Blattamonas nauphoetae TaxID=2049346 RepID=A0ABQ9WWE2_9EUKA|nr:hypothetical protein BLNAU_21278 [Blattamonas nauphoetae]
MIVVLFLLSSLHSLNSTVSNSDDTQVSTKKFGPQRYKKPNFFEVMGRGFYRMWRPLGNTSFMQFPAVGSAAELGETIIDYMLYLIEEDINNPEETEEDPVIDPTTMVRNDKWFPDIAQAMSLLLDTNISTFSTIPSPLSDVSVESAEDPYETFFLAVIGWIIGIAFSWIPCLVLWIIVDGYCCGWCCGQCCMGCARCCNCCCRCCRNRKPIFTCGCYDKNGPKKCWIYVSKIIWTVLTAGYIFGGIVATVAAFMIPTFIGKIYQVYDDVADFPPSLASRAMPLLVTALPAALAPLSTIASDLDSDTLPLLNLWDKLFHVQQMLFNHYFVFFRSPYDMSDFSDEIARIYQLTAMHGVTFTADVVPCDTFEGESTLANIKVSDDLRNTLLSQFFEFDYMWSRLRYHHHLYRGYPESVPEQIDDLRWLNSYLGSASHTNDIANAKSLLSTFKANVVSHRILDEIMEEFERIYQASLTYTRTPDPDQCFTELEDFKHTFVSVVTGPAAYSTVQGFVWRIRELARTLAYDTPWSRRELAKTVKKQIVPGNNGTSATFKLILDDEIDQLQILADPSNFNDFKSNSCDMLNSHLGSLYTQLYYEQQYPPMTYYKRLLDRNFRFSDNYGTENNTKTVLDNFLGELEEYFAYFSSQMKMGFFQQFIPTEVLSIVGTAVQSVGYTLAGFQLTLILVYVLMIVLNWTCPNDSCLCCQNLINFFYYILFGMVFMFFALLAILLQDIQDALYSDKEGRGAVPMMETSGFADQLISLYQLDQVGLSPELIRQGMIYVLQGPTYRSKEKGRTEIPNPLGDLLDALLLGGIATNGINGSIETAFKEEKGVVSPAFAAKLAPIEQEVNTNLASFFNTVCDETNADKGVFTYNYLGRSAYEIADIVGLDMVNVLMMFYFAFNLAFVLFIPQTVCTSVGRTHWPPYKRARDDPDYAEEWDEEDEAEGKEKNTPDDAQLQPPAQSLLQPDYPQQVNPNSQFGQPVWDGQRWVQPQAQMYPQQPYWDGQQWVHPQPQQGNEYWQQGQPMEQGNGDWSGQPQQTLEVGEAEKGEVGLEELPVTRTDEDAEMEEMERPHAVHARRGNESTS